MERTAKKRVLKEVARRNIDGKKGQNKSKMARSNSPNIAITPEVTVKEEPIENVVQLLNEIVPDEKSLTIKLEYDPEFPVTDDCLNLAQLQQMKCETDEESLPCTQSIEAVEVKYLDTPYTSRADKILNMSPITDDELEMYGDLYDSQLMDDTTQYDWCKDLGNSNCMFQWFWSSLPNPPTPVEKRKCKFLGTTGPTKEMTLYEAFTSIWDKKIMEHIVSETNKSANQLDTNWTDTTVDELYVFIAISLATNSYDKKDLMQYWQAENDFDSNVTKAMTYTRFRDLNNFISFNDVNAEVNDLSESEAIVSKIKPVIIKLNKNFRSLFNIGQDVVFDEPYEFCKSEDGSFKLLKNTKDIKEVNICDAKTGYVRTFLISAAKKDSYLPPRGISPSVILKFMEANKDQGYTIWCDNIFNSALLARAAYVLNCNFVGTLRLYEEIGSDYEKAMEDLKAGKKEISGGNDNDVDFILWRDKSIVSLVSTYHGGTTNEEIGRRAPTAFVDFKNNVASLEKRDNILADYIQVEGKTWVRRMFDRLLNVSVFNSLVICKNIDITSDSYKEFRQNLILELISRHVIVLKPIKVETLISSNL